MANRGSPDDSVRSPSPEIPESDDVVQTEETSVPSFTSSSAGHAAAHVPTAGEDDEEEVPSEEDGVRDWVQRKVRFRDRTQLKRIKQDMWNENKAFQNPVSTGDGTVELEEYDRAILKMVGPEIESNEHLSNCLMFNKVKDYVLLSEQCTLPPPSLSMTPLEEFMELPPIDGRDFRWGYKRPSRCQSCTTRQSNKEKVACDHQDPYEHGLVPMTPEGWDFRFLDNCRACEAILFYGNLHGPSSLYSLIGPSKSPARDLCALSMPTYRSLCICIALCAYVSLSVPTYHSLPLHFALCAYVSLSVQIHPDPWLSTRKHDSAHAAIKICMASLYTCLDLTEDDACKFANAMCRLLERWPNLDEIIADDYQ